MKKYILLFTTAFVLTLSSCTESYLYDELEEEETPNTVPTIIPRDTISDNIEMYPD